jgi:hypothetical protein
VADTLYELALRANQKHEGALGLERWPLLAREYGLGERSGRPIAEALYETALRGAKSARGCRWAKSVVIDESNGRVEGMPYGALCAPPGAAHPRR